MRRGGKYVGLTVDNRSTNIKIQDALAAYDREKSVFKQIGMRDDHPSIKAVKNAVKNLSADEKDNLSTMLNCFFDVNPNIENASEADKKHASFKVFKAILDLVYDTFLNSVKKNLDHRQENALRSIPVRTLLTIQKKIPETHLMTWQALDVISTFDSCDITTIVTILESKNLLTIENLKTLAISPFTNFQQRTVKMSAENIHVLSDLLKRLHPLTQENFDVIFNSKGDKKNFNPYGRESERKECEIKRITNITVRANAFEILSSANLLAQANFDAFVACEVYPFSDSEKQPIKTTDKFTYYNPAETTEMLGYLKSAGLLTQANLDAILFIPLGERAMNALNIPHCKFTNLFAEFFAQDGSREITFFVLKCLFNANLLTQENYTHAFLNRGEKFLSLKSIFSNLKQGIPTTLLTTQNVNKLFPLSSENLCHVGFFTAVLLVQKNLLTQENFDKLCDFVTHKSSKFFDDVVCSRQFFDAVTTSSGLFTSLDVFTNLCSVLDEPMQEVLIMKVFIDPECFDRLSESDFTGFKELCASVKSPSAKNKPYFDIIQTSSSHVEARANIKAKMIETNRQAQKAKVMALDRGGFFKHAHGEHLPADTAEEIVDNLAGEQPKKPEQEM